MFVLLRGRRVGVFFSFSRLNSPPPPPNRLSEVADPASVFHESGYGITLATPKGGAVPLDPRSLVEAALTPPARAAMMPGSPLATKLKTAAKLEGVVAQPFDVVFLAGGHAACDPAFKAAVAPSLARAARERAVVGAVCHGLAALLDSNLLAPGVRVTGFSDAEEKELGPDAGTAVASALGGATVESALKSARVDYACAPAPWGECVVVDAGHRLVTGQNPASAEGAARECVRLAAGGKGVAAPPAGEREE